uniref:Uncharacterized protein n=1 Tax=Trypanosoma congolense (strain IL3000) TaxID=1068625 RepID=G0URL0_TRYCI|nr:hypothetical protein, unlikely [Trypanosoma congolense IL3000]
MKSRRLSNFPTHTHTHPTLLPSVFSRKQSTDKLLRLGLKVILIGVPPYVYIDDGAHRVSYSLCAEEAGAFRMSGAVDTLGANNTTIFSSRGEPKKFSIGYLM